MELYKPELMLMTIVAWLLYIYINLFLNFPIKYKIYLFLSLFSIWYDKYNNAIYYSNNNNIFILFFE